MVAPLQGTETLREAQGGKEEVGEGGREDKKKNLKRKEQYEKYLQIRHKSLHKY